MKATCLVSTALIVVACCGLVRAQPARIVSASFYDPVELRTGPMVNLGNGNNFTAGVPAQSPDVRVNNWNDLAGSLLTASDLFDATGIVTTVDMRWTTPDINVNNYLGGGTTNGDSTMMNGHLINATLGQNGSIRVSVMELGGTFDLARGYDVLVYADMEFVGNEQTIQINDFLTPLQQLTMRDNVSDIVMGAAVPFDFNTDYDEGTTDGAGVWLRFRDLRGDRFELELVSTAGDDPAFINGIQIVGYVVPEPSAMVLAGVAGACGVLIWRNRRR